MLGVFSQPIALSCQRECSVVVLDGACIISLLFLNLPNFPTTQADAVRVILLDFYECTILLDRLFIELLFMEQVSEFNASEEVVRFKLRDFCPRRDCLVHTVSAEIGTSEGFIEVGQVIRRGRLRFSCVFSRGLCQRGNCVLISAKRGIRLSKCKVGIVVVRGEFDSALIRCDGLVILTEPFVNVSKNQLKVGVVRVG